MRLLKLLAYALIGYLIYEFWQGIQEGPGEFGMTGGEGSDLDRALNDDTGRMQNMTGTGRGTTVTTEDDQGMSVPHVVGRGVVNP